MTIVAGTYTTYASIGNREQLMDSIYNISPTDTPIMTNIGRAKATAKKIEWQTDTLNAPDTTNAQLEGDDFTYTAPAPTSRVGNFNQISRKVLVVSGSEEAIKKAGRKSEIGYQMAKRSEELKKDMEAILFGSNQASLPGNTTTAPLAGSFTSWTKTNVSRGAGGANGGFNTGTGLTVAATDGTTRAFTEPMLKAVMQSAYQNGGKPTGLYLPPSQKIAFSSFAGIAVNRVEQAKKTQATIVGAADFYVSDFGTLGIIPNRLMRSRDAFLIDPTMLKIAYLRPFMRVVPAQTGDAMKRAILVEYTLVVNNEAAHGVVADLL